MYDFSFNERTLNKVLKKSDFKGQSLSATLDTVIQQSIATAAQGFTNLGLKNSFVKNRNLYQFTNLSDELVIRKLARNVRTLTRVKQADRDSIVKSIKALVGEGHNFSIHRLDIKSFYESISRSEITTKLSLDSGFPPASLLVWKSFLRQLDAKNVVGLPRGLALSATMSEYLMREFDSKVRSIPEVYFYVRYVDDIFILSTATEISTNFLKKLKVWLPDGLKFNSAKSKTYLFNTPAPLAQAAAFIPEHKFDFLGYEFAVSANRKSGSGNLIPLGLSNQELGFGRLRQNTSFNCIHYIRNLGFDLSQSFIKRSSLRLLLPFLFL